MINISRLQVWLWSSFPFIRPDYDQHLLSSSLILINIFSWLALLWSTFSHGQSDFDQLLTPLGHILINISFSLCSILKQLVLLLVGKTSYLLHLQYSIVDERTGVNSITFSITVISSNATTTGENQHPIKRLVWIDLAYKVSFCKIQII